MAKRITVMGNEIAVVSQNGEDFISLTDMLRSKDGDFFISDWLRNRNTIEFLGIWEKVFNPDFNYGEFALIKSQAGLNSYKISVKEWVAKINYRIHTDAIQAHLIPDTVTKQQAAYVYANEADVLNVALFGITAKQWREANPGAKGNIRDQANAAQLVCPSNMESLNAEFIKQGIPQSDRLRKLNAIAIEQMKILVDDVGVKRLKGDQ